MSSDPSNLSVDFWMPQTWNRYSYTLNNPLSMVDRNGQWPTSVHNQIINEAFPGMSAQDLQTLKDASYNMDYGPGQQSAALSFEHGMSGNDRLQDGARRWRIRRLSNRQTRSLPRMNMMLSGFRRTGLRRQGTAGNRSRSPDSFRQRAAYDDRQVLSPCSRRISTMVRAIRMEPKCLVALFARIRCYSVANEYAGFSSSANLPTNIWCGTG